MDALGKFGRAGQVRRQPPAVLGRFGVGPTSYGVMPAAFGRRLGNASVPALTGLFREGPRTVGISQINAMATNFLRGSGG